MYLHFLSGSSEVAPPTEDTSGGPLTGDLQGVAVLEEALDISAFEELLATTVWTDVTDDVEMSLTIDRGIHEDTPIARIAPTGTCALTMDNSELNTAGLVGYYSPPNANARPGFDRGTMMRVSMLDSNGRKIPQFIGKIRSIKPTAGIWGVKRVDVVATDWMDEASRFPPEGLETQRNVRADDIVRLLVDSMRNRPHGLVLDAGTDVYPFALDVVQERQRAHNELKRAVDSERGIAWIRGDGALVVESRYSRTLNQTPVYIITDVLDADQSRATEDVVNRVKVTIYPRRQDETNDVVLYSSDSPLRIDTGMSTNVLLPFRDPTQEAVRIGGIDLQWPPEPYTDFEINSEEDGTGDDLTPLAGTDEGSPILLTWRKDATSVGLTIQNDAARRFSFTKLQIRGRGLYHYDPLPIIAENKESIDDVGLQEVDFEMPYQDDVAVGQAAASLFLNLYNQTPTKVREVPIKMFHSSTHRRIGAFADISTPVAFSELVSGVDGVFFINAKRIVWRPGFNVDVTLWLAPTGAEAYAVFNDHLFDDPAARFAY